MHMRALACFTSSAISASASASAPDAIAVLEQLHDAIQALAVKKTALKQKAAAHEKRGIVALKQRQLPEAKDEARRKLLALKHVGVVGGLQANLEHIYAELDVLHTVQHASAALERGSAALEHTLGQIDLQRVQTLLDTLDTQLERGQEVTDAMATPLAAAQLQDDNQLEELMGQWDAVELPPAPVAVDTGAAPQLKTPARVALLN